MPAPTDLNSRIALAKGWTWDDEVLYFLTKAPVPFHIRSMEEYPGDYNTTHWVNPKREPAMRPDFVGTLEGMSGMLWELGEEWTLHPDPPNRWLLWRDEFVYGIVQTFDSPREKLGDCVGDAYMSVFGKEAIDAKTTD